MLTRYPIGMGITVLALVVAGHRMFVLFRLITSGGPAPGRMNGWMGRIATEIREVVAQRKLLSWTVPGIAHAMTFWGFTVLLLTIIEAYGDLFKKTFAIPGIGHSAFVGFVEDFFICSVILAVCTFVGIRIKQNPQRRQRASRFYGSHTKAAWFVLAMITLVMVTLLGYRAAQVNTGDFPYGWWAFASHGLGNALHPLGIGANRVLETVLLDLNIAVIMGFLVFVAYSKHLHIFLAPINVAFSRQPRALGPLDRTQVIDPETMDENTVFGAGKIEHFSWKQLLDMATCTECGRCQSQCPAWATGKPLSPKLLIMDLRDELFRRTSGAAQDPEQTLVPNVIDPDVLWSCTTCGACVEECPVDIEHVDAIIDLRRYEVLMESRFPSEAATMFRNIETKGDPWGLGASARMDWTKELDFEVPVVTDEIAPEIEYLLWVGCAGAFDDRARSTTRAIARLLKRAGVTFAVLGPKESCTGDPARRSGNEFLYQTKAQENIEILNAIGARKIIASCPHCFNSIGREYPALGGNYEVVHHSQLLDRLIADGKLSPGRVDAKVTYHDPCYLGRHNRVFDQPRSVLDSVEGLESVEMHRNKEHGFCCGAGGARMWLEETIGKRVNLERTDEALATGASIISTACPYCMVMLDDGVKARERNDDVEVLDIAQLMERSMDAAPATD